MCLQELPRIRPLGRGDLLGRAGRDDLAAGVTALGTEIDDMIGGLDHVEMVLDQDHRVPRVDEWFSDASSRSMSARCNPVVGSSRM